MLRRPPRSTPLYSSAASDVYKRQGCSKERLRPCPLHSVTTTRTVADFVCATTSVALRSERAMGPSGSASTCRRHRLAFGLGLRSWLSETRRHRTSGEFSTQAQPVGQHVVAHVSFPRPATADLARRGANTADRTFLARRRDPSRRRARKVR